MLYFGADVDVDVDVVAVDIVGILVATRIVLEGERLRSTCCAKQNDNNREEFFALRLLARLIAKLALATCACSLLACLCHVS